MAVSGGVRIAVGGLLISARSPLAATTAALVLAAAWYVVARKTHAVSRDLEDTWHGLDRHAAMVTVAIAAASGTVAALQATFAATGADASGYLSEAELFASGRLFYPDTLAPVLGGWHTGLTAPLGWKPAPLDGFQSPTYPPGLPMLMAIPHWAGGTVAACGVVIASAAIAVWATGMVAMRLAGGTAAIVAAVTLAVCPVLLFQSVQPMSDVPVTAAWMLCWWLLVRIDKPAGGDKPPGGDKPSGLSIPLSGLACAIAVLIRPNLAPLAVVPLAFLSLGSSLEPRASSPLQPSAFSRRLWRALAFSLPVALAALILLWLQWNWYGSSLRSGYGTAGELFATANIGPNAAFYMRSLVSTTPITLVAAIGVWLLRGERMTWALVAFAVLVLAAYLGYAVFEDWSYLRFLLPALAVGSALTGVAVARMVAGIRLPARAAVLLAIVLAIAAVGIAGARARDAFDLQDQHQRIVLLGDRLNSAMPADAVVVAGEQSGSMRYYTGRPIIRWDTASPADLARVLTALQAAGRPVWIVLDAWEHELLRKRFPNVPPAALEWPPAYVAGTTHRTTAWELNARQKFIGGEHVATVRLP